MKRILIPLLIAVVMLITFTAAAEGDSLVFDKSVNAVNAGETVQTVLIREGAPAEGEVAYTSSDARIATVDENGLVTGIKRGTVTISAAVKTEAKTWQAALKLSVIQPAVSVTVKTAKLPVYDAADPAVASLLAPRENAEENSLPVLLLSVKKKVQINADVEPKDASSRKVTLESSDPAVFTASKNTIVGVAPGEAILTVASDTNPEAAARFRVLVIQPVTKLSVSASAPYVIVGGQATVTAEVTPANATISTVTWSSGTPKILAVDENGIVSGLSRGSGRIIAAAADGSKTRANFTLKVVQLPESISLKDEKITVDIGKTAAVKATVLPKNADNKGLVWTSSDESIATVDKNGRIKAVGLGDCLVTCACKDAETVTASVAVTVQQPVTKVSFNSKTALVYVGETTQLEWTVLPANATNPELTFKSNSTKIATVDEKGLVTGVKGGKTTVTATTTDGSKRTARIEVRAGEHVSGVSMQHSHAYIDYGEGANVSAKIEPKDALNKNMTWESANPGIATAAGSSTKVSVKGVAFGTTTVTGTTEDGGFRTDMLVTVGDFDHGLRLIDRDYDNYGENIWLTVRNDTDFTVTMITAELEMYSKEPGVDVSINKKNGTNKVNLVWKGTLAPGEKTGWKHWKAENYVAPPDFIDNDSYFGTITLIKYNIENEWIKTIRQKNRPWLEF